MVSGIKLSFGENLHVRVFTSHFENEILVFSQNSSQNPSLLCVLLGTDLQCMAWDMQLKLLVESFL